MNGRLIDADAFKKILSEHEMVHDKRRSFDNYDCGAANAYEHASDLLDDMPTVKQPHGTWIESKQKKGHWYCSECIHTDPTTGTWRELFDFRYPFCPNCGLPMKRTEE